MQSIKDKGLVVNDERIKDYILYSRGNCWTPKRFYDYLLINIHRPHDIASILKEGFIKEDINNIINQFDGISFEYLIN